MNSRCYCDICGECICENDEYIVNEDGEFRRLNCIQGSRELVEWLGYEVKTMSSVSEY